MPATETISSGGQDDMPFIFGVVGGVTAALTLIIVGGALLYCRMAAKVSKPVCFSFHTLLCVQSTINFLYARLTYVPDVQQLLQWCLTFVL